MSLRVIEPFCAWVGELGSLELDGYQSGHRPEPSSSCLMNTRNRSHESPRMSFGNILL